MRLANIYYSPTSLWQLRKILDLLLVDVLEQIKVNINVISRCNLDTVRNIDKFCQFGYTYASNLDFFLVFIFASIYHTIS